MKWKKDDFLPCWLCHVTSLLKCFLSDQAYYNTKKSLQTGSGACGERQTHSNPSNRQTQRRKENEYKLLPRSIFPEHLLSVKVQKYKTREFYSSMFFNNLRWDFKKMSLYSIYDISFSELWWIVKSRLFIKGKLIQKCIIFGKKRNLGSRIYWMW